MNKNIYQIDYKIQAGLYEFYETHFINANTQEEAEERAVNFLDKNYTKDEELLGDGGYWLSGYECGIRLYRVRVIKSLSSLDIVAAI